MSEHNEPTQGNLPAIDTTQPPRVSVEKSEDGNYNLTIGKESSPEEFAQLKQALGISQVGMLDALLRQIGNSTADSNGLVEHNIDFAIGLIQSIAPENEVEVALAAQMAAVHIASMDTSRRFMRSETLEARDSAERAMNKLMRTFIAQMDGLKRYRSKAQQIVRVERVTVEEGGQAIVGPVSHGGGARTVKSDDNPMNPVERLRAAPRCHAMSKQTRVRCKCPAVRGWRVCRVHGAGGGHKAGPSHPKWVHGCRSKETISMREFSNLARTFLKHEAKL